MQVKFRLQRFVFPDGGYQDYPDTTDRECVVVMAEEVPDSKEYNAEGKLVDKITDAAVLAEALRLSLRTALGKHIDDEAKALGYDSIISAVSYKDEPEDEVNQAYGMALSKWRSSCYRVTRELESQFTMNTTWEELKAGLPIFVVPELGGDKDGE